MDDEEKKIMAGEARGTGDAQTADALEGGTDAMGLNSTPTPVPEGIQGIPPQDTERQEENPENPENPDIPNADPEPALEETQVTQVTEIPEETQDTQNTPGVIEAGKATRTFTQEQVNEMIGNTRSETRERTFRYVYDRYGVKDEAGLDDLVGDAQRYESLSERFKEESSAWKDQSAQRDKELSEVREQVALLQSGIDRGRYDDARLIIRGKGLEVSPETIAAELATHPEWNASAQKGAEPKPFERKPESHMTESVMGNGRGDAGEGRMSDEDYAMKRLFKI